MAMENFLTHKQAVALENRTDADIREQYREMERRSAALQARLGYEPDLEDWEEYEN